MAEPSKSGGSIVSGVAGRYASALFELAQETGAIDAVDADLRTFEALLAESEDLRRLVGSPVFSADEQRSAMNAVMNAAGIGGLTANFVKLVASKRRLFLLPSMIRGFRALVAQARGIVSARVSVAEAPSESLLAEIRTAIAEAAGAEIDLEVKVDPALIGGLVVKVGSRMIDASLRTKLNSIRLAMKEVR